MTTNYQYLNNPWQHLSPWPVFQDQALRAMSVYLHQPSTQSRLATFTRSRVYLHPIRDRLHALGLSTFFADALAPSRESDSLDNGPVESRVTMVHLSALNYLTASVDTSLAITVGVNPLALLPIYIAADTHLLNWAFERVRSGAFGAMLLTEIEYGSNLLRNQTCAEPGVIAENGQFRAWRSPEHSHGKPEPTHYRLSGRKDLINGGSKHELLVVFARTRQRGVGNAESGPLAARSDFSFFVVERDASVSSRYRWETLPVPAADISSVELRETIIPAAQRIGREGSGFTLAQKTLAISRGSIGAMAAGLAHRAAALAATYAQERAIYGEPILQLGAIVDHLLRMRALELLVTAMSVKAVFALNAYGPGAAHYGAVAKYACCVLTEALVTEGRYLFGSRGLLSDHPYHHLIGDAPLLSTFDGTTHLVLDQIQWRLNQLAMATGEEDKDWLNVVAAAYRMPPQRLIALTRTRSSSLLVPPPSYLRQLEALPGHVPLRPLIAMCQDLLALTRHCRVTGIWETDQGLRFQAGKLFAHLETLIALVELADPHCRNQLGMPALAPAPELPALLTFTYGWFGGQNIAELRTLMLRVGLEPSGALVEAERSFGCLTTEARDHIRSNLSYLTGR